MRLTALRRTLLAHLAALLQASLPACLLACDVEQSEPYEARRRTDATAAFQLGCRLRRLKLAAGVAAAAFQLG